MILPAKSVTGNIVGITELIVVGDSLRELAGTCNIVKAYTFNTNSQRWVEFPTERNMFSANDIGNGLLVKVASDCYMSSDSVESGGPPAVPN